MRLTLTLIAVLALAACQPATQTAEVTPEPTPEEMGQDEPGAPFEPAPVGPPTTYEPYSKTAMSFTPGVLTVTPTPQQGINLPPGANFAFGNGYTLETTLVPGGAGMGETPFDFSAFYTNADGSPTDVSEVEVYSVEKETVPATGAPNGGFCDKTGFIAVKIDKGASEDLKLIAFSGDGWPPASETAVCGTFNYMRTQ